MHYMPIEFDGDSSSLFPFRARTYRHTHSHRHLGYSPRLQPEWDKRVKWNATHCWHWTLGAVTSDEAQQTREHGQFTQPTTSETESFVARASSVVW